MSRAAVTWRALQPALRSSSSQQTRSFSSKVLQACQARPAVRARLPKNGQFAQTRTLKTGVEEAKSRYKLGVRTPLQGRTLRAGPS